MAAGIMQRHARRLSPLLCSRPFTSAEAKLGIPARSDSDAFECFGTDGGGAGWGVRVGGVI